MLDLKCNNTIFLKPVIVDEIFMLKSFEMKVILDCMRHRGKLILFGDPL